jgi:pyrroline-5-carboxylate reductase
VKVYDHNAETLDALKNTYPQIEKAGSPEEAAKTEVVIIAVHPPVVMETLDKIAGVVNENTFVVSLAPKITIEKIASKVKTANIVRMIPNATSYINEGYNPLAFHPAMLKKEKKQIKKLFKPLSTNWKVTRSFPECYPPISGFSGRNWRPSGKKPAFQKKKQQKPSGIH